METTQTIICRFLKELNIYNANTIKHLLGLSKDKIYRFFDSLYTWEYEKIPTNYITNETDNYTFCYKLQVNLVYALICSKVSLDMNRLKSYYNALLIGYDGRDDKCLEETFDFRKKHKIYFEEIFGEKPKTNRMCIGVY